MVDLNRNWLWMIHLSPLAPGCGGVEVSARVRNIDRSWSLLGGVKSMLTRCKLAPHEVTFELQREGDPVLVRLSDRAPLAFVWAGPDLPEIHAALAILRNEGWLPPTYIQQAAAA